VGDRVEYIGELFYGEKGTVMVVGRRHVGVGFDSFHEMRSRLSGKCKKGHGWIVNIDNLKLIKEAAALDKTIIEKLLSRAYEGSTANAKAWASYINVLEAAALNGKAVKTEEGLAAKRDLLVTLVAKLPIKSTDCYYCQAKDAKRFASCDECPYGEKHMNCNDPKSDYVKIRDARDALVSAIRNHHRDSDVYTAEKPLGVGDVVKFKDNPQTYKIVKTGDISVDGEKYDAVVMVYNGVSGVKFTNLTDLKRA
jgi:hypothetical protein